MFWIQRDIDTTIVAARHGPGARHAAGATARRANAASADASRPAFLVLDAASAIAIGVADTTGASCLAGPRLFGGGVVRAGIAIDRLFREVGAVFCIHANDGVEPGVSANHRVIRAIRSGGAADVTARLGPCAAPCAGPGVRLGLKKEIGSGTPGHRHDRPKYDCPYPAPKCFHESPLQHGSLEVRRLVQAQQHHELDQST
jgi:hypothetical protein